MPVLHSRVWSQANAAEIDENDWNADHVYDGNLEDGAWVVWHAFYRLRLTGTGSVILDARDSLGNITAGVESFSCTAATDQIEYPFMLEDTIEVRATLSGTATAEII